MHDRQATPKASSASGSAWATSLLAAQAKTVLHALAASGVGRPRLRSQDRPGPSGASEESGPELRLAATGAGAFIVRDAGRAEIIHGVQRGAGRCKPLGGSCQWDVKLKTCRDLQRTAVLRDNGRGRAHATRAAPIRPGLAGACVHQTNERVARRHLARNGALSSLAPPILIQAWHRAIHTDLQHLRLGLLVAHIPHLPSPFPPVSFIGIADIHPSLPLSTPQQLPAS